MKRLIRFALPFLGSALIQQLYSTTDLIFAGWYLGSDGVAAIGGTSIIATVIIGIFTGLSVGISTHVARLYGEKNYAKIKRAVGASLVLIAVLSVSFVFLLEMFAGSLLSFLHIPDRIFESALMYLRIYSISVISITLYNVITGILRAMGDSVRPMLTQFVGGIANVILNYLLIVRLQMGVFGAGLTTLISQTIAAVLTYAIFARTARKNEIGQIRPCLSLWDTMEILKVGIPSAVQASIITLSNFFVQSDVNTLGVVSIAAFASYYKVENFIYYPIMAVGQANAVIAAQDYGSGDHKRMFDGVKRSMIFGLVLTLTLAVILIIMRRYLFLLFGKNEEVIELGMKMICISFPFYFLYLIMEVLVGTIRSTGDAFLPMMCVVINMCPVRLFVLHLMMKEHILLPHLVGLYPITWATTVTMLLIAYVWWKRNRFEVKEL